MRRLALRARYPICPRRRLDSPSVQFGRDEYAIKYRTDVERQAAWLEHGAAAKADSVEILASRMPTSVLEVGCGTGGVITELRRRNFGEDFYGVDFSEEAIRHLAETDPTVHTTRADITVNPDPFGDGPYDLIVATHVVEHLEEPERFLVAMRSLPHKEAVIEVPLEDLFAHRLKARFRDRSRNSAGHVQFFTAESFEALVERSGHRVIAVRRYAPVLSREAVRLAYSNAGLIQYALKMLTQRVLPLLISPVWCRWYHAHYAVLTRPVSS